MSRIVVIGATGHVGTYLVPRLVRAGHDVVALSRGEREPHLPAPEWRHVERVRADREAEDATGVFGERIAALAPDAVVDMLCFTPESAQQLVGPVTEDEPRTAYGEYGTGKAAIEALLQREPSPAESRAWCSTPGISAVRGRPSRRRATSISTSGAGWPSANRSPCPTSVSGSCTTCTATTSPRPSHGR
jgi:UDP-glucose 4-epimerase